MYHSVALGFHGSSCLQIYIANTSQLICDICRTNQLRSLPVVDSIGPYV